MADERISTERLSELDNLFVSLVESFTDEQINIFARTPIDIVQFSKTFGFNVAEFDDDGMEGFILIGNIENRDTKMIGVNRKLSFEEKRFAIAHELAHFFLDSNAFSNGQIKIGARFAHIDNRFSSYNRKQTEQEADYFAACLLIPREKLLRDIENFNVKEIDYRFIKLFAKVYDVSWDCLLKRIGEVTPNKE